MASGQSRADMDCPSPHVVCRCEPCIPLLHVVQACQYAVSSLLSVSIPGYLPSAKEEMLRTQKAAIATCLLRFTIIAAEAHAFFARRLRPLVSLAFLVAKFATVVAQWMVLLVHRKVGQQGMAGEALAKMLGQALLLAALR